MPKAPERRAAVRSKLMGRPTGEGTEAATPGREARARSLRKPMPQGLDRESERLVNG